MEEVLSVSRLRTEINSRGFFMGGLYQDWWGVSTGDHVEIGKAISAVEAGAVATAVPAEIGIVHVEAGSIR
jgi:hypothetical protein